MNGILLAITPEPSIPVVVATGLVLVFLILVLLMAIITVEGKIFGAIDASKKAEKAKQPAQAPAPVQAAPAPVVEEGIPQEVVAAIAAAVACMDDGAYVLRKVSRADRGAGNTRGAWGRAGVSAGTQPF